MIEWTDKRGRRNVFVLEPLDFGVSEPPPPHPFEPHYYGTTDNLTVSETCWCGASLAHSIHEGEPLLPTPERLEEARQRMAALLDEDDS